MPVATELRLLSRCVGNWLHRRAEHAETVLTVVTVRFIVHVKSHTSGPPVSNRSASPVSTPFWSKSPKLNAPSRFTPTTFGTFVVDDTTVDVRQRHVAGVGDLVVVRHRSTTSRQLRRGRRLGDVDAGDEWGHRRRVEVDDEPVLDVPATSTPAALMVRSVDHARCTGRSRSRPVPGRGDCSHWCHHRRTSGSYTTGSQDSTRRATRCSTARLPREDHRRQRPGVGDLEGVGHGAADRNEIIGDRLGEVDRRLEDAHSGQSRVAS